MTDNSGSNRIVKPYPAVENVWEDLSKHTSTCGANNFYYNNGTIEFVLNGVNSCQVRVKLSNYIQITARLTVSVANFYNNNGPTTFLTNICAFLGIDPGRLKIVSVKTGSTEVVLLIGDPIPSSNSTSNATNSSVDAAASSASLTTLANQVT